MLVKLLRAHTNLRVALLFWEKLTADLRAWGFTPNRYDECVVNKQIEGSQCMVLWNVDDLKISHVNPQVVTDVLELLAGVYGQESPLTITRGKHHDYLGMHIDYSNKGKVSITMTQYIEDMLLDIPQSISGMATKPAANHLFKTNPNGDKLSEEWAQFFHFNVAKLLFLCKRARPDIQTGVAFLSTRVQAPDADDIKK